MRLEVSQAQALHSDLVSGCGWSVWNELFTCSDDQTIQKWSLSGEPEGKVCQLDTYYTDMHWYPLSSKKNQTGGTDVFAVGCTNGTFKIISRTGRIEKSVDAHTGACIGLRWSYDGTALATAGEDGSVKIWSRTGMLRSTLAQNETPVYCICWASDSDQLCYSTGSSIVVRSVQSNAKQQAWRAHEGVVLKVDWSAINNLIVSGGEDCKYKVWDSYGRLLYQSSPHDTPITSVSWCPSGDCFAVGSFDTLQLCDAMGWAQSKSHLKSGSLLSISWTPDGTQLAAVGGSGAVVFASVVGVAVEDGRVRVEACGDKKLQVSDLLAETQDELDFRDKVVKISLGFDHLIVATCNQCHIYSTTSWNTPHIFDLKDPVTLLTQCERCFLLMDNAMGIQLFTYEGRQICNPKMQGLRTELLNHQTVSLSNDTLAILDTGAAGQGSGSTVRFFDTAQGRPMGEAFTHSLEIKELVLSQSGNATQRLLAFIDRNRDLHVVSVSKRQPAKLAAMVDSAAWHDTTGMLAAMVDTKLTLWYAPSEVFVDNELLNMAKWVKADGQLGKAARIIQFSGSKARVRLSDGVLINVATSPYPLMLYELQQKGAWDKATRLCRFIKDPSMWACLAAMSLADKQLHVAEAAFAALDDAAKRHWVSKVKAIPTEEGRAAQLALYRKRPDEAEAILVQAGLLWRAIKLNIKLFRWQRALDLAQQAGVHTNSVLWYRQRYLAAAGVEETLPAFQELATAVTIDEVAVKAAIQEEKLKEAQRQGAKRYV